MKNIKPNSSIESTKFNLIIESNALNQILFEVIY
jgi:hypothetical protein